MTRGRTTGSRSRSGRATVLLPGLPRDPSRLATLSICSAQPHVLRAAARHAAAHGLLLLIESTSSQVNQFGGYTGMRPAAFARFVRSICRGEGFPVERLVLGADHLGPYPWRSEDGAGAMGKALDLARECVQAGYRKIHLDASMALGGDPGPAAGGLSMETALERSALLCRSAEEAFRASRLHAKGAPPPCYVIGTDVPSPGGIQGPDRPPEVTPAGALRLMIRTAETAFRDIGLQDAWRRVVAVVVQPGVDFSVLEVFPYDGARTAALRRVMGSCRSLVLEAHSTDFQTPACLRRMAEDGIGVVKVGPALSFAMREAYFALAYIEDELHKAGLVGRPSRLRQILEGQLRARPGLWKDFYRGKERTVAFALRYGLSDRVRYCWHLPPVQRAVGLLGENLRAAGMPFALLSQFLPSQHRRIRDGLLTADPDEIVVDRVRDVLEEYRVALTGSP